jgi:flavodoxin
MATTTHARRALVLYGSETGNAHDVAEQMGRIAERLRFDTHVSDLNSIALVRQAVTHLPNRPR